MYTPCIINLKVRKYSKFSSVRIDTYDRYTYIYDISKNRKYNDKCLKYSARRHHTPVILHLDNPRVYIVALKIVYKMFLAIDNRNMN